MTLNDTQGITFSAITMRIRVHTLEKHSVPSSDRLRTIGSIPLRRIQADITQDLELADDKTILSQP